MQFRHTPVMPAEVRQYLNCRPGSIVVDGTLGGAGHARDIWSSIQPHGKLIGIDRDHDAISHAQNLFHPFSGHIHLIHDNYARLPQILENLRLIKVDAILVDLGISLHQIKDSGRGFSFQNDEPLDMRMDIDSQVTAADLVNRLSLQKLADILWRFGEERRARRIAKHLVKERRKAPIQTSGHLATIVQKAIPTRGPQRIHPATRTFMALRIAVNQELEGLATFLAKAPDLLNPGGRLCMLAFHSLEDRMVKHRFKELAKGCICPPNIPICSCQRQPVVKLLTRKAIRPSQAEVAANPMARSTRLRAVEKM